MATQRLMLSVFLAATLATATVRITGQAPPTDTIGTALAENGALWFVELASPPTADGTALAQVRAEKAAFRQAAARSGVAFTERFAFDTLWNGLAVAVDGGQVGALARVGGVRNIYPIAAIALPETAAGENPDLATALSMTGADVAQSELGLTGRNVRVAVMDTGIDYHHTDLGGCFGPGCRVAAGHDFVGNAYNNDASSPS